MESLGTGPTMLIAAGVAGIGAAVSQWLAPETKGRQLEAIRQYWYNGAKWPEEAEKART